MAKERASAPKSGEGAKLPRDLGNYELIEKIGDGGMAEVYLARKRGLLNFRKLVVVKTVKSALASDPRFIKLLLEEARLSALLKHPKVVDIYDLGLEGDTYFIAMEYLAGQSVTAIIKRSILKQRRLDVYSSAQIIADAAEGLHAVHHLKGLDNKPLDMVHLDVSPGNIIVLYNGHVKLVDFGVSKVKWKQKVEGSQDLAFKVGYAAPEQLRGATVSPRSDVYSLGAVMWELLTHRRLCPVLTPKAALERIQNKPTPPPSTLRKEVPTVLDEICLKALEIDPDDRFQAARDMQHELEAVLREAGRFRESAEIERFMESMFAHVRQQHAELIKDMSTGTDVRKLSTAEAMRLREGAPPDDDTDTDLDVAPAPMAGDDGATIVDLGAPAAMRGLPVLTGDIATQPTEPEYPRQEPPSVEVEPASSFGPPSSASQTQPPPVPVEDDGDPFAAPASWNKRSAWLMVAGCFAAGFLLYLIVDSGFGGGDEADAPVTVASAGDGAGGATPVDSPSPTDGPDRPDVQPDKPPANVQPDKPPANVQPDKPPANVQSDKPRQPRADKPEEKAKPDRAEAKRLYREGVQAFARGSLGSAKSLFRRALKADPRYAMAHRGLGLVYERSGSKRSAVRSFKRYLRSYPKARDAESIKKRIARLGG